VDDQDFGPLIIVRRRKRHKHGHHGGAWKVAYADFVTAMMAFFLVMWLLGIGTREQRAAISEYFKNPSMTPGVAAVAPPGQMGPGGASDSAITLGGAMDLSHGPGKDHHNGPVGVKAKDHQIQEKAAQMARAQEKAKLQELMDQLHAAIQHSQALAPFKDQLLIDITPEGLRIQIVDKLNRPMFDSGSAQLKPYTQAILEQLGGFINRVPNRISITGHTDDAPYSSDRHYSNWELSSDRANAARRALIGGSLREDKIARVVGLAASVPMDRADPRAPRNRRISIIVMTREAEAAALSQDMVTNDLPQGAAIAAQAGIATALPPPAARPVAMTAPPRVLPVTSVLRPDTAPLANAPAALPYPNPQRWAASRMNP
jgi:chemotaxis protein MotB